MDADVVEALGKQLRTQGQSIRMTVSKVDALVNQAGRQWDGGRSRAFVIRWQLTHRRALLQLAESIEGLGQSALNNAAEQRHASGFLGLSLSNIFMAALAADGEHMGDATRYSDLPFRFDPFSGQFIDKEGQPISLPQWSGERRDVGWQGSGSFDAGPVKGEGEARLADYYARGTAGMTTDITGMDAVVGGAAGVMLFAASGQISAGALKASAAGDAGVNVEGRINAHAGIDRLALDAEADAFVGVKGSVSATQQGLFGSTGKAEATGMVGFGLHGAARADVSWRDVTLKGGFKGAYFVGGGYTFEVHVDPVHALNEIGGWGGNDRLGEDAQRDLDGKAREMTNSLNSSANSLYHGAQDFQAAAASKVKEIVDWRPW